jgi:hypothetical protein
MKNGAGGKVNPYLLAEAVVNSYWNDLEEGDGKGPNWNPHTFDIESHARNALAMASAKTPTDQQVQRCTMRARTLWKCKLLEKYGHPSGHPKPRIETT